MKSLNTSMAEGCPFDNSIFTQEIVNYILSEGFEWRSDNDSYSEWREASSKGCYKKYENGSGFDIYIYICEDGIEIDQDYDCGGNLSNRFIPFNGYENAFEEAYDEMVDHVNYLKR